MEGKFNSNSKIIQTESKEKSVAYIACRITWHCIGMKFKQRKMEKIPESQIWI